MLLSLLAHVAQLVEHFHGKEGVSGSSPLVGSSVNLMNLSSSACPGITGVK